MIGFKKIVLGCVIGRRGIRNTAFSFWPCQNDSLKTYLFGVILILSIFLTVAPAMGQNAPSPNREQSVVESTVSDGSDAPAPMTDIHDILSPVAVGFDAPWLAPVLIGLGVVVLLAVAWWLWEKNRKKKDIETIVPELPPEMTAMQALDSISDVRGQEGKKFYFCLSAILRQYVFGRFSVGAPEMTTEEFLPCIDRLPINNDLAVRLKKLCRSMDPVKFGGASVMEKQMEEDLFFARAFVRKTTQTAEEQNRHSGEKQDKPLPKNGGNSKLQIPNLK